MIYRWKRKSSVGAASRAAQVPRSFYLSGGHAKARERNRFVRLGSPDLLKSIYTGRPPNPGAPFANPGISSQIVQYSETANSFRDRTASQCRTKARPVTTTPSNVPPVTVRPGG
jgi:hypothetical protein